MRDASTDMAPQLLRQQRHRLRPPEPSIHKGASPSHCNNAIRDASPNRRRTVHGTTRQTLASLR